MVRQRQRSSRRVLTAALLSLGLIAAACGKKDDSTTATDATVNATETTAATGDTQGTVAADTSVAETTPPETTPAQKPVPGGEITVSGEAEVANAWIPAAMQCDTYCHQRARTFFEPIASFGVDNKVHPFLAESITPNADFTRMDDQGPAGDLVHRRHTAQRRCHDREPAAHRYLHLDRRPSCRPRQGRRPGGATNADGTPKKVLKIEKADDMTFTIFTGKDGDPAQPLPWPGFDVFLTSQFGLIASPTWLAAVDADATKASQPVGTGPFIVESYAPRDALVVTKNPNYWRKDADGVQLPVPRQDHLQGDRGRQDRRRRTAQRRHRHLLRLQRRGHRRLRGRPRLPDVAAEGLLRDQLPADRHREARSVPGRPGPVCVVEGDRPSGDHRPDPGRQRCSSPTACSRPARRATSRTTASTPTQDIEGAKALIAEYQAEHPGPIQVTYGHTADRINAQRAELIKGYWSEIGVDTTIEVIPQDQFITNALFGADNFFIYGWRLHAGIKVDQQNLWWNSRSAHPDGQVWR